MLLKYLNFLLFLSLSLIGIQPSFANAPHFPEGTNNITIPITKGVRTDLLKNIAPLIQQSIAEGKYPGAIILASHHGHIIYRGIFGSRRILPNPAPMTF